MREVRLSTRPGAGEARDQRRAGLRPGPAMLLRTGALRSNSSAPAHVALARCAAARSLRAPASRTRRIASRERRPQRHSISLRLARAAAPREAKATGAEATFFRHN